MTQAALVHIYLKSKRFQGFGFRDFTNFLSVAFLNKIGEVSALTDVFYYYICG